VAEDADLFSMHDNVAIVTGAAGLYGRPIAEALAAAGATVVLASRDLAATSAVARALEAGGRSATAHTLDLADPRSIERLCADVLEQYGRIDVLVNNAVQRSGGELFATSGEDFGETHAVNATGLFLITRHCAQAMVDAHRGSIVNIASIYGVVGPDFAVYGDTGMTTPPGYAYDKGGMIAFSRYLATYLGPNGVRSNCLVPGGLETDQDGQFVSAYRERTPLRRMAEADDIKGPVVFLASEASRYVTGITLPVDGGWTAQ
jgi:NAD(P)-dependent dehydrogenase (short-subunit alcohol dehydrogenase family)